MQMKERIVLQFEVWLQIPPPEGKGQSSFGEEAALGWFPPGNEIFTDRGDDVHTHTDGNSPNDACVSGLRSDDCGKQSESEYHRGGLNAASRFELDASEALDTVHTTHGRPTLPASIGCVNEGWLQEFVNLDHKSDSNGANGLTADDRC